MPEAASTVRVVCDYYRSRLPEEGRMVHPPGCGQERDQGPCAHADLRGARLSLKGLAAAKQERGPPEENEAKLPPFSWGRDEPRIRNLGSYWPRAEHMLS